MNLNKIKKKRILIDLERLKYINTGLGQVCLNFGKELAKYQSEKIEFVFLVPRKYKGFFGNNISYEVVSIKRKFFSFLCSNYDLWYSIHQDSKYFPSKSSTPYVLTVHDLNFIKEKTAKKVSKRLKRLQRRIDRAVEIVTISDYTKKELLKQINYLAEKKIRTIYNGIKITEFDNSEKPNYVPKGDILFTLGVIKPKKNQKVLVDFIQNLPKIYKLIIAGNDSSRYAEEIKKEIFKKGLQNRIILSGEISNKDKYWLYKNSFAVLFPSLYEGMGMPPIEAMRFGKPVFVSKKSSIPEICGENAFYWENFEPNYMSSFFLKNTEEFYSDINNSLKRVNYSNKFNWSENTKKYFEIFMQVLQI